MPDTDRGTSVESNRQSTPIVAVLGHGVHGNTTLLDTVRGSAVSDV